MLRGWSTSAVGATGPRGSTAEVQLGCAAAGSTCTHWLACVLHTAGDILLSMHAVVFVCCCSLQHAWRICAAGV
jgi:hypothetical protein